MIWIPPAMTVEVEFEAVPVCLPHFSMIMSCWLKRQGFEEDYS